MMRRALAMLVLVAACGRPASLPAPVQPLTVQALAGGCYRLFNADTSGPKRYAPFWAGLVRLDSARSTRFASIPRSGVLGGDPRDVVTLAPASGALTRDTLRSSSHWEIRAGQLHLTRTTGFTGETTTLSPAPDGFAGEREFWTDVIVPGAPRRVHPVRFIRQACPSGSGD